MITTQEILRAGAAPFLVGVICAAVGWWRGWRWMGAVGVGSGFLIGLGLLGVPGLPPRDGIDWLFWMAGPATAVGVVDVVMRWKWGWMMGAVAGVVGLVIVRPLTPGSVSMGEVLALAAGLGAVGAIACFAMDVAEPRIGGLPVAMALCVALVGAAVVVLSSNVRIVGVYGMAATAAMAGVMVLAIKTGAGRSVAIVAMALMAGLLAGGHYYAEPGVSWMAFGVLMGAPMAALAGAWAPVRKRWVKGVIAVVAVAIVVGVVTGPVAIAARRAAEGDAKDPYEEMYR